MVYPGLPIFIVITKKAKDFNVKISFYFSMFNGSLIICHLPLFEERYLAIKLCKPLTREESF